MNRALLAATFDRWLASPPRLALVGIFWILPVLSSCAGSGGRIAPGSTVLLVLALGAGIIGRDVSTGVLQVLFARPVPRPHYVFSRWAALGLAGTLLAFGQILFAGVGALNHGGASVSVWALQFPVNLFTAFGTAAVLILFSSLLNGFGDVAVYLALLFVQVFLGVLAGAGGSRSLEAVATGFGAILAPGLNLHALAIGEAGWLHVVSYFSTVTLALALAAVAVNRKEISYAAD